MINLQETRHWLARQIDRLVIFVDTPPIDENVGFVCPECGSHYWGTSVDGKKETGHCHDQFGVRCKFKWDRKDDSKYFKPRI